ncbi:MAG TPA: UvrD-helicase domain-containing protein [bacterium]|mgnify:FL=1|nr:UvrD-helicase domain-containing protein [bacterium]
MPKIKTELNEEQLKAVKHKSGPVLVVAGAGTGKTRVITERIRYLIKEKNVDPQEILALTFTEKAAQEMVDRVGDIMPLGYEEPWVYTFHSFADRILKEKGIEIGIDPSYKILSPSDQWLLLRKNLFDLKLKYFRPLGNPTKFISAILTFISRLQDENISPEELQEFVKHSNYASDEEKQRWEELSYIYAEYERLKIEGSAMDFGNLIIWVIKLLNARPNILAEYKNQFKHILVDEFQDTNYAQYELIKLLFPTKEIKESGRSLLVVGDDSQSIYKFRGAAVSNILQFMEDYKDSKMITLLKNYRSTQEILDAAYKLIQNNNPDTLESKLGISKKLIGINSGSNPKILQTETLEDEVELVISKILEILAKEPQYTYKDFAILARANNHLDPFVMALRKYGLPYQLVGNRGLYDRDEVRDILAFLRVIINTQDGINLYRVLNIESLEIPYKEISELLSKSRYEKTDLWEQVKKSKDEKVAFLVKTIEEFQKNITKNTPTEMVFEVVNSTNYLNQFLEEETVENELCIKNLNLFLQRVQKFEVDYHNETGEMPTVVNLVDYLDMIIEAGENPAQAEIEDIDTINLMTVHASKGLEFPVVFMVNLVSGRFPTRNQGDTIEVPEELIKETLPTGNEHIQEERRLFYVGMTRAQKYLFMTLGKNYGGKRDTIPSGYLQETGLKIQEIKSTDKEKKAKQSSLFGVETKFREPKIIKIEGKAPEYLSYSQIDNYLICPLRYKYSYTLKIPVPPKHTLSFGTTIHETLKEFHVRKMFGKEVTLDELLEIYEKKWIPLGYRDEKHRKAQFEYGKEVLKKYYEENNNLKFKHLGLEKNFILDIDGLKINGKIDRIDQLPDGKIEIIDYKTGNTKTQKEVDNDVQMTIYTMAATEALKIKPDILSFYYVESGTKLSTKRTKKQVEAQKKIIKEVAEEIKEGNFEPKPGKDCEWCDYKEICPFAERK